MAKFIKSTDIKLIDKALSRLDNKIKLHVWSRKCRYCVHVYGCYGQADKWESHAQECSDYEQHPDFYLNSELETREKR